MDYRSIGENIRKYRKTKKMTQETLAERAGLRQSYSFRWTGFGSEQPEIATRNTATLESVQQKARGKNPLA